MDYSVLHCYVTVRLMEKGRALGPGVVQVLEGIRQYGSLQGAARSMEMSYTKAWTILKNAERIWGFPLTHRYVGGKEGGRSVLTAEAEALLTKFQAIVKAADEAAEAEFQRQFSPDNIAALQEQKKR